MTTMNNSVSRSAVTFKDVHMVFFSRFKKPVHALQGFSLDIVEGSIVGLLGPNGCGKTTAISCLLGLLQHQAGKIFLWGKEVNGKQPARPDYMCGVLLEDTKLPPFLSVSAALDTVGRLRGLRDKGLKDELDRVIAITQVEPLLSRRISVLSKGQARRVGVASALIGDPNLLVLDEPSAGLDVAARVEFNELLRKLRSDKRTIIIASHLLSDIETTCTHIAIMQQGRILLYENSQTLFRTFGKEDQKDIFIDRKHADTLQDMHIPYMPSKYPGLLLLTVTEPEHELISRLAQAKIVPGRIEPKENLISLYLDVTKEE